MYLGSNENEKAVEELLVLEKLESSFAKSLRREMSSIIKSDGANI